MEQAQSGPERATQEKRSTTELLYEAMWGSPIPFAVLSVLVCIKADNDDWTFGKDVAWWIYLGGWASLLLVGAWAATWRRKPKTSTALFAAVLLVAAGGFQIALNGSAAPWH